ncbi:hypothetical protein [Acidianus brierleyi]|uniref:Uncharacterized protein n=1 Tax=Acidianus brierleyi TaxID=41673 RepID=A0A2U9IEI5_9CREN|nr:hypothetical protein [Acidianus brierleyi]AWR94453.1 hypothetical protein DFR85_07435 [Acidianus brierleyi]
MLTIREIIWNQDIKSKLTYDGRCVSTVVKELPQLSVIRQACYIFFNVENTKIKDKSIYFMLLLNSTTQIKECIERNKVSEGDKGYLISCCKEDINDFSDKIEIKGIAERIALTFNAVYSVKSQ